MRCPHPGHLLVLHQISILETTLIMGVNIHGPTRGVTQKKKGEPIDSILDGQCPIVLLARLALMPWHAVIEASGMSALHTDDFGLFTLLGVDLAGKAGRVLAPHKETTSALLGAQE